MLKAAVLMTALIGCVSCGPMLPPSSTAVGDWSGRNAPLHFAYFWLRITQQGNRLQGTACYTSELDRVFGGVPVAIDYPNISVSGPDGFSFIGKFQNDGTVSGSLRFRSGAIFNTITLSRDMFGGYDRLCMMP